MDIAELLQAANREKSICNYPQSQIFLQQALQLAPQNAEVHFQLGELFHLQDQWVQAEAHYLQALQLQADLAPARQNLWSLYLLLQKVWHQRVQRNPQEMDAWFELGRVYTCLHQYPLAVQALKQVYALSSEAPQAFLNLVDGVLKAQDLQTAGSLLAKSWEKKIEYSPLFFKKLDLAILCQNQRFISEISQKLIEIDPSNQLKIQSLLDQWIAQRDYNRALPLMQALADLPVFQTQRHYDTLANLANMQGQSQLALEALQNLKQLFPQNPWYILKERAFLPLIYQDQSALEMWIQRYQQGLVDNLQELTEERIQQLKRYQQFPALHFSLAYLGQNIRPLLEMWAQYWLQVYPPQVLKPKLKSPWRVGFVSSYFYSHSIGVTYQHLMRYFYEQPDFETVVLAISPLNPETIKPHDNLAQAIRKNCHLYLEVSHQIEAAAALIREQALDIVIFPELGMDACAYFLACTKLAPIQVVLTGHPITSGLPTVDYFISADALEHPDLQIAQSHYTEKLIRLSSISVNYPKPLEPSPLLSRQELGYAHQAHIYLCPVTLFKLHPDFDPLLAGILAADPQAQIYFFEYQKTQLHRQLLRRFENTLGANACQRIHFLSWQPFYTFLHYLKQADVILDPPHFGLGTTGFQALAMLTPVITWPGERMPSRQVYSLYNYLDEFECVASNAEEYIQKSVRIAREPDYRRQWSERLKAKVEILFDNAQGSAELVEYIRQWLKYSTRTQTGSPH